MIWNNTGEMSELEEANKMFHFCTSIYTFDNNLPKLKIGT